MGARPSLILHLLSLILGFCRVRRARLRGRRRRPGRGRSRRGPSRGQRSEVGKRNTSGSGPSSDLRSLTSAFKKARRRRVSRATGAFSIDRATRKGEGPGRRVEGPGAEREAAKPSLRPPGPAKRSRTGRGTVGESVSSRGLNVPFGQGTGFALDWPRGWANRDLTAGIFRR
jgi:hypothetical protein